MNNTMLALFSDAKRIYGFCPCCDELFRLSNIHLYTKEAPAPTPFDDLDRAVDRLDRSSKLFASREKGIREEAERVGQVAARKRLKKLAPFFADQRITPKDVKVLFHPVGRRLLRPDREELQHNRVCRSPRGQPTPRAHPDVHPARARGGKPCLADLPDHRRRQSRTGEPSQAQGLQGRLIGHSKNPVAKMILQVCVNSAIEQVRKVTDASTGAVRPSGLRAR